MLVKILKPFHHSDDGITSVLLRPSEDPDHREEVRDDLCPGLSGEGYIDGAEHGLPLLSGPRKEALIDRIGAAGRVELAKCPDDHLLRMAAKIDEAEHVEATAEPAVTAAVETAAEPVQPTVDGQAALETAATTVKAAPTKAKKAPRPAAKA